jgi:hypothetical protein
MNISPNVVILTTKELREREDRAFQRGVERGKFEAGHINTRVARNCIHWRSGRCETCGSQIQAFEVSGDYKCPHFVPDIA